MKKAERIALRKQLGSQKQVAELIGVTRETVSNYERAAKVPRVYELALLALREKLKA